VYISLSIQSGNFWIHPRTSTGCFAWDPCQLIDVFWNFTYILAGMGDGCNKYGVSGIFVKKKCFSVYLQILYQLYIPYSAVNWVCRDGSCLKIFFNNIPEFFGVYWGNFEKVRAESLSAGMQSETSLVQGRNARNAIQSTRDLDIRKNQWCGYTVVECKQWMLNKFLNHTTFKNECKTTVK